MRILKDGAILFSQHRLCDLCDGHACDIASNSMLRLGSASASVCILHLYYILDAWTSWIVPLNLPKLLREVSHHGRRWVPW